MLTPIADLEPLRVPGQRAPSGPKTPSPPAMPWTEAGMRSRSVLDSIINLFELIIVRPAALRMGPSSRLLRPVSWVTGRVT